MPARTLDDWLTYQENLHPNKIELGLDRVRQVYRLLVDRPANTPVIIVGGTNGKGSTIACLESIYRAAGYRTGSYTSPHILKYNERIRINNVPVDDETLIHAFEDIENSRKDISLTYFEFGTLAALLIYHQTQPDILLLEVGLGGRLDAVNIIEPDVAIITSIALDHMEWLGDSIEQIALEKAGIARSGKPLIFGGKNPPASLLQLSERIGADLCCMGREFGFQREKNNTWSWWGDGRACSKLPYPALPGEHQLENCATAIQAIFLLENRLPLKDSAITQGLSTIDLPGRYEITQTRPTVIYDVAHNAAAGKTLAKLLGQQQISGKTYAVIGMQSSREPDDFIRSLSERVDKWYACTLTGQTVHSCGYLADAIRSVDAKSAIVEYPSVAAGLKSALIDAEPVDRIVVTGSFLTVAQAKEAEYV